MQQKMNFICSDSKCAGVIFSMCADLVVGLNLQKKRGNHADSFLSADVSLQTFNTLKKALVQTLNLSF